MIMSSYSCDKKEIGGYFGLELGGENIYEFNKSSVLLNSARSCLRYVIRAFGIKEIWIPYYTCPVVWQSVQKEGCKIKFYHINKEFYPEIEFEDDAYILYTNYFGVCGENVIKLAKKYKNLIIDNAQAFYMPKFGIASFNSVRKFFGVSDGAILECDKCLDEKFEFDVSFERFSHLLKRIDVSASFGYGDFCKNDDSLCNEPIKYMSNLTKSILASVDVNKAKQKRIENFRILSSQLNKKNELKLELGEYDVPMVYPLLLKKDGIKQNLIKNKIYVATYWNPLPEDYQEGIFQRYLIPLPIDQRYNKADMEKIIEVLNGKD